MHPEILVAAIAAGATVAGTAMTVGASVAKSRRASTQQHAGLMARLDERLDMLQHRYERAYDANAAAHERLLDRMDDICGD